MEARASALLNAVWAGLQLRKFWLTSVGMLVHSDFGANNNFAMIKAADGFFRTFDLRTCGGIVGATGRKGAFAHSLLLSFLVGITAIVASCGSSSQSSLFLAPSPTASPTPALTASPTPTVTPLTPMPSAMPTKGPMHGLLDLGNISFYTKPSPSAIPTNDPSELQPFASSFTGIVINVTWAQLQPLPGEALADNNPIDQGLAAVQSYNSMNPGTPLQVKLRVWGGLTAPEWVKAQAVCGTATGPIDVEYNDQNGNLETGSVGAWWTPTYISEWRSLQALLAEKYDANPLIQEVAVTSCASSTDEPFVAWTRGTYKDQQGNTQTTINVLQQCGYSDSAQQDCLMGAIEDYSAWTSTPIDYPFSIYQITDLDVPPAPKLSTDPGFTALVMKSCADAGNCILSNQALRNPNDASDAIVYTTMAALYPTAIDFQTASPANIMDWCGAVGNGVNLHGLSIEMWGDFGGFLTLPDGVAIMANLSNAVLTRSTPAPSPCPPVSTATPSPAPTP
jgi:hypothetical protein